MLTTGCDSNALNDVHLPNIASRSSDDADVPRITPDSSIPILLTSNKQNTAFTINGHSLGDSKTLKVKVPHEAIKITAQAPCYRPLEQRASADGFGPWSQFEFTFATWDRDPNAHRHDCT